jgi:Mg2+-importing ATPase
LVVIDPTTGIASTSQPFFWTAWFIESISTQTLVIFVLRTKQSPFFKSKPSKAIAISSLSVVVVAIIIPYTPLGIIFQFGPLEPIFFIYLAGMVVTYLVLVEFVKKWFYKKWGHLLEKTYSPVTSFSNHVHGKKREEDQNY